MPPVPHYLSSSELIVEIDFARGWVLVGELARASDPKTVCRHFRWRFDAGKWYGDRPGRDAQPKPSMDGEAHEWRQNARTREGVVVTYALAYVNVSRRDLTKALDAVRKLAGSKVLDVDGLVTVHVHAGGVELCSHGEQSLRASVEHTHDEPARDGLGTVVVCGPALLAVAKAAPHDYVQLAIAGHGVGQVVCVERASAWTVNVAPMPTQAAVMQAVAEPVDLGLTAAIERALVFASTDAARPNLHGVMLDGQSDHVHVVATDGHRLYRERVTAPLAVAVFGGRKCLLPRAALTSLRTGKRGGAYRFAFDGDDVIVVCDGRTVVCPPSKLTFPPYNQIIPPKLHAHEAPFGGAVVALSPETAKAFRAWVQAQVKAGLQYTDAKGHDGPCPIQLSIAAGNDAEVAVRLKVVGAVAETITTGPGQVTSGTLAKAGFEARFSLAYLASGLEALDATEAAHVAVGSGELDPVYLLDSARIVCLMPQRW